MRSSARIYCIFYTDQIFWKLGEIQNFEIFVDRKYKTMAHVNGIEKQLFYYFELRTFLISMYRIKSS